jgi:arginyl-tRNA synthetase
MKTEIEQAIAAAVQELFNTDVNVELTRPDEQFGDYATNIALQLSKLLGQSPRAVADAVADAIRATLQASVATITVAGPGFLNLTLNDRALIQAAKPGIAEINRGMRVLLEYSCPNAFKELHTGHLYQTIAGDAMGKILEATGATVYRANFGGDVGLHVAKCLYGITETLGGEVVDGLEKVPADDRAEWLSAAYVLGASAYEADEGAKARITEINSAIYAFHTVQDHTSLLAQIYWTCRAWSYEYFKSFYDQIQVAPFNKYYPESSTIERGMTVVQQNTGSVFSESDGAVIYKGEDAGLHTRVFITSKGLPTYETKDMGVVFIEADDFSYDKRVIMTGNDQSEYMKVVFAAIHSIDAELAAKQTHITNGTVRFGSGQKMSSRLGNVTRAVDVLSVVNEAVAAERPASDHELISLAAIKYSFLKHRLGGDIAFDITESVSLEGNSGPYLQYAYARATSILGKAEVSSDVELTELSVGERSLVRKLAEYSDVVQKASTELMPHHICNYLYELAQKFNQFYEHNRVIGDEREAVRVILVRNYAETLKSGLAMLGITAPEHM